MYLRSQLLSITSIMASLGDTQLPEADKSPLDISYALHVYPILKFQAKQPIGEPLARVMYSRPPKNGRQLFGGEIKYNELLRLGANEATEIEFFKNVKIEDKNLSKGSYTIYCIPQADRWTLIFSKDDHCWGTFDFNIEKVVARVQVPLIRPSGLQLEYFSMYFDENNHMNILWDDLKVILPMRF